MLTKCVVRLENTDFDTKGILNIGKMLGSVKTLKSVQIKSQLESNLIGSTALEILNTSSFRDLKDNI